MPVPAAKADARKPASARAAARGGGKGQELQRGGELSIAFSAFAGSLLRPRGRVRFAVVGAARESRTAAAADRSRTAALRPPSRVLFSPYF